MPAVLRSILAILGGYFSMAVVVILITGLLKLLSPSWIPVD